MKRKYLTLTAIILILSSFLIASMLLGEGSEPMATLLDGHSQSHYTSDHALLAVHPSASLASAYGQAFTVKTIEETYKLTQTKFYLKRVGSPTGHLKACLYSMTGTYGTNAKPTGSPLASSELVDIATLGTSYSEIAFNFVGANQYEVSKDQKYCIEVQVNDGSLNSNNGVWCKASSGDQATHDGNESYYSASAWRSFSDKDFCFLVYGEYVAPPPPPQHSVTLDSNAYGYTDPSEGVYECEWGTFFNVTGIPYGGYEFDYWLLDGEKHATNPISFMVTTAHYLTAYFKTITPSTGVCTKAWQTNTAGTHEHYLWQDAYGRTTRAGQRIIVENKTVCKVSVKLKKVGSPSGTIYMRIRNLSNGIIATSPDTVSASSLTTTATWKHFSFWCPLNQEVRICVEYESGTTTNYVKVIFLNEDVIVGYTTSYHTYWGWIPISGSDLTTVIYEGEMLAPVLAVKLGGNLAVMLTGSDKGKVVILV